MNEIYHHGVKGQKWGVRRTPKQLGYPEGSSKEERKQFKQDVKVYRKLKRGITGGIVMDRYANRRKGLSDRSATNTMRTNMQMNRFVGKLKRTKGEEYTEQVKTQSKKIDVRRSKAMKLTIAAAAVTAVAGAAATAAIIKNKVGNKTIYGTFRDLGFDQGVTRTMVDRIPIDRVNIARTLVDRVRI